MSMFVDDRTDEQKKTHRFAVVGTDSFMSGWGRAHGGASYAGWAFRDEDSSTCLTTVVSRSEMKRVRVVDLNTYRPTAAHTHIYVFEK